ncbi:MAG: mitochondrial fission ELM1 family protein [Maricaulaceae bacterium]
MNTPALNCLVLSDGRRGILNQALGLAEAAARIHSLNITTHMIENGRAFKALPPRLQFALRSTPANYGLTGTLPSIAIGCGRQAIAPLLAIKKARPKCFTIHVQDPRISAKYFDLVVAPEHDTIRGENVETMIGSPNRITPWRLEEGMHNFAKQLADLPTPRAAILIGGNSKTHKLGRAQQAQHIEATKHLLGQGYSLMISTSRRTPDWAIREYHALSGGHDNIWLYDGEGDNPYFAFLGAADIILVTEDSTNMLTESCATGKPVFTLLMQGYPRKFINLYNSLHDECNVKPFTKNVTAEDYKPLNETTRMAENLWDRFNSSNS